MQWTDERKIHIHTVIHLNKGDDNTAGIWEQSSPIRQGRKTVLQINKNEFDKNMFRDRYIGSG